MKTANDLDIKVIFKHLEDKINEQVKISNQIYSVEIIDNNKVLALMNNLNENNFYEVLIEKKWYEINKKSYLVAHHNGKEKKFKCCVLKKEGGNDK